MNSRIIISDVHGCFKTLMTLMAKLPFGIPVTFAGDLIDRSADSRRVVEFVKNGGYDCVVGNHEVMMMDELKFRPNSDGTEQPYTDQYHGIWEMNGGTECLKSYITHYVDVTRTDGQTFKAARYDTQALKDHVNWMATLPYKIEYPGLKNKNGDYLLVTHSNADRVWDKYPHDSIQFKNTVVWDRKTFPGKIPGIFSCYGHTPQKGGPTVKEHFAAIDGGAYLKLGGFGVMYALQFPEMVLFSQENIE